MPSKSRPNYAFVDAANLFYGGEKSLGWKIDYQKLAIYIKQKYSVEKIFYFGGIELEDFDYSPVRDEKINLIALRSYVEEKLARSRSQEKIQELTKRKQQIKFYQKLEEFGYRLKLKPVKLFRSDGHAVKKANCDVDMTFELMRAMSQYSGAVILSGDGDFFQVLKYLMHKGKQITILARGERTAKEIRQLAGSNFRDFATLRRAIEFKGK